MTTPERLRRRQRIEGAVLIILGALMVAQAVYFNSQDVKQRDCIEDAVVALSENAELRAGLAERDSKSKTDVILAVARAKEADEVRAAFDRFIAEQARIEQARTENQPPPYPAGTCD